MKNERGEYFSLNARKWRRPINYLMLGIYITFFIIGFIPGLFTSWFLVLFLPWSFCLGYTFEFLLADTKQPQDISLINLRSLYFPVGFTIILVVIDIVQSDFAIYLDPWFWIAWAIFVAIWLIGAFLYRYFNMNIEETKVEIMNF